MRHLKTVLMCAGLAVMGFLVYRIGAGPIVASLRQLLWWQFVLVCLPYAVILTVDTLGWRFAFARDRTPFLRLVGARLVGESLNIVTALGSVGGEAAKAWLASRDSSYEDSVASVVIAKTTTVIAQTLFLAIGIAIAWITLPFEELTSGMLTMLFIQIVAVGGFLGVQLIGVVGGGGRLLARVGVTSGASYAGRLDRTLRGYYWNHRGRLSLSIGFHLIGWILGVGEALTMLWALGVGPQPLLAFVVEAFGSGVRFATFFIPGSLGVFEGANAGAFESLRLGASVGLAFSFLRRGRQVVWIVIGLVVLAFMRPDTQRAASATDRAAA